jgi:hypothetical protein
MLLVCMQKLLFINYKTTVGFVFKCINRDGCSLFNILKSDFFGTLLWKSDVQFSPFGVQFSQCANCILHAVNSNLNVQFSHYGYTIWIYYGFRLPNSIVWISLIFFQCRRVCQSRDYLYSQDNYRRHPKIKPCLAIKSKTFLTKSDSPPPPPPPPPQ